MKRLLLVVILIVLILSFFTIEGFALEYTDIQKGDQALALDVLASYGIIKGYPDATFRPGNCVTRAELAKISVILLGYDEFTKDMTSEFSDMSGHWAERYVELIDEMNIIKGYDDNTFKPNNYITYTETVVAILKILGYNDSMLQGDYPENYQELARSLGLLKNVNNPSIYMTRQSLATLIYNALYLNTITEDKGVISSGNKLIDNLGRKETVVIDDKLALMNTYIDLTEYLFMECDVYYDNNDKIVLVTGSKYPYTEGLVKSSLSHSVVFLADSFGNTKIYDLSGVPVIFNGVRCSVTNDDLKNSKIRLIYKNENHDEIIGAVATKATDVAVIRQDDVYEGENTLFAGIKLPTKDGKVSYEHIVVEGDANSIYDIKPNDVVYFYQTKEAAHKSKLTVYVVRKSVTGIYNGRGKIYYEDFFTINLDNYKLSDHFKAKEKLEYGDKITALLDIDNKIIEVNILKYNKEPETYAVVYDVKQGTSQLPTIGILNRYGKAANYELRENSGAVSVGLVNGSTAYYTDIERNSIIKYDKYDDKSIKIAKKMNTSRVSSNYNKNSGELINNNYFIDKNTIIIQLNNGKHKLINRDSLGYYVEGKAVINNNGVVEMFLLEKNLIKTEDRPVNGQAPVVSTFTGNLTGVISNIGNNGTVNTIKLYNSNSTYNVDKALTKTLENYKNRLVKIVVSNSIVKDIYSYSPEITKCKVTAVYNGQLQIDGLSYVEYSNNVKVYICTQDSSGNITAFKDSTINEIKVNSIVQFYNTDNNYNGVMDVIVIYN